MAKTDKSPETIESLTEKVEFLTMQLNELTGKHGGLPKPEPNEDFSYEKDHDLKHFREVDITTNMSGIKEGSKQLIPNKVLVMPTKHDRHHEQGKPYECDSRLAEVAIRRGFATHHKTWEEFEKENKVAEKKAAAEKK